MTPLRKFWRTSFSKYPTIMHSLKKIFVQKTNTDTLIKLTKFVDRQCFFSKSHSRTTNLYSLGPCFVVPAFASIKRGKKQVQEYPYTMSVYRRSSFHNKLQSSPFLLAPLRPGLDFRFLFFFHQIVRQINFYVYAHKIRYNSYSFFTLINRFY